MLQSVREGEPVPKRRPARNSDKLLVGRTVVVELPAFGSQAAVSAKMLWEVKGDTIDVELNEANAEYVIAQGQMKAWDQRLRTRRPL